MTTVAVFFPSLMGVGILVSGALLLGDLVKRLFPRRGLYRRHRVAMGAFGVVAATAAWADREVSAGELFDRVPRHPATYLGLAAACTTLAVALPYYATEAYEDELGLFFESPWMVGLGTAAGILFGVAAVLLVGIVAFSKQPAGPVRWLITRTSLGRLQVPESASIIEIAGEKR